MNWQAIIGLGAAFGLLVVVSIRAIDWDGSREQEYRRSFDICNDADRRWRTHVGGSIIGGVDDGWIERGSCSVRFRDGKPISAAVGASMLSIPEMRDCDALIQAMWDAANSRIHIRASIDTGGGFEVRCNYVD